MKNKRDNYSRSLSSSTLLAWQRIYHPFDLFIFELNNTVHNFCADYLSQKTFFLLEDTSVFIIQQFLPLFYEILQQSKIFKK